MNGFAMYRTSLFIVTPNEKATSGMLKITKQPEGNTQVKMVCLALHINELMNDSHCS
jgi:hypothetical protein